MKFFSGILISLNSLRNNPTRTALTMLGIVIGIAAVIAMMAIGNGSKRSIRASIEKMGANSVMVMPGSMSPPGAARQAAGSAISLTGADAEPPESLRPLLGKRVDRLSGGQFQLLTVWACLGGEAQVVVLDEPTNNMDPSAVDALADLLQASRGDRAVLVVTHDARFLAGVSARILEVGR